MNKHSLLIRASIAEQEELVAAKKYFEYDCYESRGQLLVDNLDDGSVLPFGHRPQPKETTVIGRYSCLPYYKEFEDDLAASQAKPINSYKQHRYIADLQNWYQDLHDLTFKTYFSLEEVPKNGGPFVLKGETNSKKFNWDTTMFAKDYEAACKVYWALNQDSLIGQQDIYIREYVPLVKLAEGLRGLPVTEEYRFFVLDGKVLCGGYYWASHVDDLDTVPSADLVPREFLQSVIDRVGDNARFYVIDVARTQAGEWKVVELNDGSQSGLSCIDPDHFYKVLREATLERS